MRKRGSDGFEQVSSVFPDRLEPQMNGTQVFAGRPKHAVVFLSQNQCSRTIRLRVTASSRSGQTNPFAFVKSVESAFYSYSAALSSFSCPASASHSTV